MRPVTCPLSQGTAFPTASLDERICSCDRLAGISETPACISITRPKAGASGLQPANHAYCAKRLTHTTRQPPASRSTFVNESVSMTNPSSRSAGRETAIAKGSPYLSSGIR